MHIQTIDFNQEDQIKQSGWDNYSWQRISKVHGKNE